MALRDRCQPAEFSDLKIFALMMLSLRCGDCPGASVRMPNSDGDFRFLGCKLTFKIEFDSSLGTMVAVGILPGPASKSNVTSMLNFEGEGCSTAGGGRGGRVDADDAVDAVLLTGNVMDDRGFLEDFMYLV